MPEQVFRMATLGAAEVLKLDKMLGSLEEGKLADMVLLDLEAPNVAPVHNLMAALVHRVRVENIMLVLVGGKVAFSRLPPKVWRE
jgi:5-methylthioadenosine/S-adenosylhomocysteine deaminase